MLYVETHGARIPALGFGTFRLDGRTAERMVSYALAIGYRHIDTAQMYGNEAEVGAAIAASGVARDDVWLTNIRFNLIHRPLSDIYVVWNDARGTSIQNRAFIVKYSHNIDF